MKKNISRKERMKWCAGLSGAVLLWMTLPVVAAESPGGGGGQ